ncbi:MAG: ADP-ribosylation factor-like protein [Promethearchaeia archaeon]
MILEAILLSSPDTEELRLCHSTFSVTHYKVLDLVKRAPSKEADSFDPELGSLRVPTFTEMCEDGIRRTFAVATDEDTAIILAGDESESKAKLRIRAGLILKEIKSRYDNFRYDSLSEFEKKDLISAVNEYIFEHTRIVLFGTSGTGKTSLFQFASTGTVVTNYIKTTKTNVAPKLNAYRRILEQRITGTEDEWFQIANHLIMLYDLPGSEQFRNSWKSYLSRADVAVLVLKSTEHGVVKAKRTLTEFEDILPGRVIAIANFQDLDDAIPPPIISRFLGVEAHGMVATDVDRYDMLRDMLKTTAVTRV